MMRGPMRPDPAPPPFPAARWAGLVVDKGWAIVLLVGVAGCVTDNADATAKCLQMYPGDVLGCCAPGDHIDHGTCCASGMHVISDVEHPDWRVCVPDAPPCSGMLDDGGACLDAGADAGMDAGADAP